MNSEMDMMNTSFTPSSYHSLYVYSSDCTRNSIISDLRAQLLVEPPRLEFLAPRVRPIHRQLSSRRGPPRTSTDLLNPALESSIITDGRRVDISSGPNPPPPSVFDTVWVFPMTFTQI